MTSGYYPTVTKPELFRVNSRNNSCNIDDTQHVIVCIYESSDANFVPMQSCLLLKENPKIKNDSQCECACEKDRKGRYHVLIWMFTGIEALFTMEFEL